MLFKLYTKLEKTKNTSLRRAAILKVDKDNKTHLSLIQNYVKIKYNLEDKFTQKQLSEAQQKALLVNVQNKELHKRLFRSCEHELVDVNQSATWLTKGNNKPRCEASLCSLQDRNIFLGTKSLFPHCRLATKTVDHLATRGISILGHDYTRRQMRH
ncbi:hypothetical protein BDAP_002013 [Binucleata daphniae]